MFLTHDQLAELTGFRQHRKQKWACGLMGVPYRVRPDGSVAVAASVFDTGKHPATISAAQPKLRLQHGTPPHI